ncbi:MAG: tol-pal system protein YbgF [Sedimenticolaceae bacterium]|nr:tol-pal system protein YbgF [Sedimenticolaceae bacterium]
MMLLRISLLVAALAATSPASATLWGRVEKLENRMEVVTELTRRVDALQQENNQLRGQIEELKFELEQLKNQQRELYLDIERRLGGTTDDAAGAAQAPVSLEKKAAEPVPEKAIEQPPAAPAEAPAPAPGGERNEYRHAYDLLMTQRKIPEAISAFNAFLKKYPDGSYADNAQFWLGEAYYAHNDLDGAMTEFQQLVEIYKESPKVPDAVYKVGQIHRIKGENDKARMVFQGLVEHYPNTPAAELAQQRLASF